MSFEVNSKYGELMSSAKWNKRFQTIYGESVILDGMDVEFIPETKKLRLTPGRCIVNGAEISSEIPHEYTLTDEQITGEKTFRLVLTYIHQPTKVDVEIKDEFYELKIVDLVLAKVIVSGDTIMIDSPDKTPSLTGLIKYIRENPGDKIFQTIEERDAYPEEKKYVGFSCFVVETLFPYYYKGNGVWGSGSSNAVYIGPNEPNDTTALWVDDEDEQLDIPLESELFQQVTNAMREFSERIGHVEYALTKELDAGYFGGKLPGEDEVEDDSDDDGVAFARPSIKSSTITVYDNDESEDEEEKEDTTGIYPGVEAIDPGYPPLEEGEEVEEPNLDKGGKGTVERIVIKRGLEKDLLDISLHDGEFAFTLDTQKLYIGNKGYKILLAKGGNGGGGNGGGGGDTGNITSEYVELIAPGGKKFKVTVNDEGKLYCYDSAADTAEKPNASHASAYKGLIINRVYGGGDRNTQVTVCSHSFIELYNSSASTINLRGLYLQYCKENGTDWQVLELKGTVKPFHSFLIRCAEHTSLSSKVSRFKIHNYDMSWDIPLNSRGMKVYLGINPEPLTVANPCNIDNGWSRVTGYIDLFVIGTGDPLFPVDAFEKPTDPSQSAKGVPSGISITKMAMRKDFKDTDHSYDDITVLDMMKADPRVYYPRYTGDGEWNEYYDKLKLDSRRPNMINICFGKDGNTTRTFTWQTVPTLNGFLKYKKTTDSKWTKVETQKTDIYHYDTNATVHRVILRNLTPGTYVYMAGEEGAWSDEYEFVVKAPTTSDTIKFLHTTDQQGLNNEEYVVWKKAHEEIKKRHTYDFHLNTGDISNDGGEFAFQWRYYYNYAQDELCSMPHMTCCGNNDLSKDYKNASPKKSDPEAYTWYSTVEDEHIESCYSFNYGYIHFVCLNSNTLQDANIVENQIPWLEEDLQKPENKKRWTIVYMHEAPYTIIKQSKMAKFIDVFAKYGVDLVLCGHHHRYSRSKRMGAQAADGTDQESPTGFYTVMSQATGSKLMGKTTVPTGGLASMPWCETFNQNQEPTYCTWEITNEKMVMKAYCISNILPTYLGSEPPLVTEFDSLEITKPL